MLRRAALVLLVLLGLGITPALAAKAKSEKAAPTVAITAPEPGVTIASDAVDVTAAYTAPEGSTITQVELLVDTTVVNTVTLDPAEASGMVTLTWEATGYLDGKHQLVVRVTDSTGRTAKTTLATMLQRGLPQPKAPITISSPAKNTTVSGVVDFRVDPAPDSSVKYVIFLVDNVFKAMSNLRPFSYRWDTSAYLNGPHKLQARAYLSDGTDALSSLLEVNVDNPSGATTMRPPVTAPATTPAAVVTPKPVVAAAPTRIATAALPPARNTASPSPYSKSLEVGSAEIGAPGTAPYVSKSGELVTPPTTVLAERTASGSELKVATVAEPTPVKSAPTAAAETSVSAPPAPAPTTVAAPSAAAAPSAPTAAAPSASAPSVAPVQVAALPTPESAPSRTESTTTLPPLGAPASAVSTVDHPAAASTAVASTPPPVTPTVTAPTVTPKPATVTTAATPKVVSPAAVQTAEPVQVAMLPPKTEATKIAPKLTAEAKPQPVTSVLVNGEELTGNFPTTFEVKDAKLGVVHVLPLRAVVEQLHGIVLWSHQTKQATVDARGNHIVVTVQQVDAQVNGKVVHMTFSPMLVEGRTMVQARFLAEALNLSLDIQDGVMQLAVN